MKSKCRRLFRPNLIGQVFERLFSDAARAISVRKLAVLLLALLSLQSAGANTIVVTSPDDPGPGTLRTALESAGDGDIIQVPAYPNGILLNAGELLVTKNVTILGPGPDHRD